MPEYAYEPFPFVEPAGLSAPEPRHRVAIVGAGPVGLSMAIDLAMKGIASVVLDDNNVVSVGSRAICWAKRTLEIFDRLGVGERMLAKGVTWKTGRLFHGSGEVYNFDLLPEADHKYPAFINLQQYYVEQYLVERARDFPGLIDLRFKNRVVDHHDRSDHVALFVETPAGDYTIECDYLLACDGANSPTRKRMGLAFEGQTFEEQFLIVDVEMDDSPFGTKTPERWFWFEPDFHAGQSALLHKQPDNVYRIDLQLGADADPDHEARDEIVLPRLKKMLGDKPFRLDWKSVYRFRCARLDRFIHNRTVFVGDSAHVVSPFGARGGNGGIQDVDNLGWKLARVLKGEADQSLLESYDHERGLGADENIRHSSRATNFMTPKSPMEAMFRAEVLRLAATQPFARKLINSGRLSTPCLLDAYPSGTAAPSVTATQAKPGSMMLDLAFADGSFLVDQLNGDFVLLGIGDVRLPEIEGVKRLGINTMQDKCEYECRMAAETVVKARYGDRSVHLLRPDGYIAASFAEDSMHRLGDVLSAFTPCGETREAAHV